MRVHWAASRASDSASIDQDTLDKPTSIVLYNVTPPFYAPTSFFGWAGGVLRFPDLAGVGAGLLSLESSVMPTISSSSEESSMTTAAALGGVALRCERRAAARLFQEAVQSHAYKQMNHRLLTCAADFVGDGPLLLGGVRAGGGLAGTGDGESAAGAEHSHT